MKPPSILNNLIANILHESILIKRRIEIKKIEAITVSKNVKYL